MNQALNEYEKVILELTKLFGGGPSLVAWREAVFKAQDKYSQEKNKMPGVDLQLEIAVIWLKAAKAGRLKFTNNPMTGLRVDFP